LKVFHAILKAMILQQDTIKQSVKARGMAADSQSREGAISSGRFHFLIAS
jgi:hypothetical protein